MLSPMNRKDAKMSSTNSFTEEENTRKLEKVFQIFLRAEEDWALKQGLCKSSEQTLQTVKASA
jgi:hypothetical protein